MTTSPAPEPWPPTGTAGHASVDLPSIVSGEYDDAAAHHDALLRQVEQARAENARLRSQLAEARQSADARDRLLRQAAIDRDEARAGLVQEHEAAEWRQKCIDEAIAAIHDAPQEIAPPLPPVAPADLPRAVRALIDRARAQLAEARAALRQAEQERDEARREWRGLIDRIRTDASARGLDIEPGEDLVDGLLRIIDDRGKDRDDWQRQAEAADSLRAEVERHAGAQCGCDTNGECLARLYQQAHALVVTAPETAPESPQTDEPGPAQAQDSTGTQQPPEAVYCRECGASMRAASRMALCPDCHAPLCSPACLDEHRGLGTCPDDADGVLGDATPAPETAPESPHTADPAPEQAEASTEHLGDADGAVAYWRAEISEILAAWLGEEQRTGWQRLASDVADQILLDLDIADMAAERARLRSQLAEAREQRDQAAEALVQAETERDEARADVAALRRGARGWRDRAQAAEDRYRVLVNEIDRHIGQHDCRSYSHCLSRIRERLIDALEMGKESPPVAEQAEVPVDAHTGAAGHDALNRISDHLGIPPWATDWHARLRAMMGAAQALAATAPLRAALDSTPDTGSTP